MTKKAPAESAVPSKHALKASKDRKLASAPHSKGDREWTCTKCGHTDWQPFNVEQYWHKCESGPNVGRWNEKEIRE